MARALQPFSGRTSQARKDPTDGRRLRGTLAGRVPGETAGCAAQDDQRGHGDGDGHRGRKSDVVVCRVPAAARAQSAQPAEQRAAAAGELGDGRGHGGDGWAGERAAPDCAGRWCVCGGCWATARDEPDTHQRAEGTADAEGPEFRSEVAGLVEVVDCVACCRYTFTLTRPLGFPGLHFVLFAFM